MKSELLALVDVPLPLRVGQAIGNECRLDSSSKTGGVLLRDAGLGVSLGQFGSVDFARNDVCGTRKSAPRSDPCQ